MCGPGVERWTERPYAWRVDGAGWLSADLCVEGLTHCISCVGKAGARQADKFLTWTKLYVSCHGITFLDTVSNVSIRKCPCSVLASACGPLAKQSYKHTGRDTPGTLLLYAGVTRAFLLMW
ncbi:hypothetical protein O3P69_005167 [Scylla paramamosain]|uniref:Uncharacterized protein n=1 Tax=Scylla paramamosain TaxID=85552 RepID=A0AAW0UAC2_SCYPA